MADPAPSTAEAPLHERLQRAAYGLVRIPRPDRPLTDDQAADVVTAAHLMMRAAARIEAAEERLARHKATDRRRARTATAVLILFVLAWLVFCAVGIALDATH
ncbi:hypothetical protein [Actinomadura bangladeshensis]|uniref:Uncharacterized protein n=1 Tax=Actinomadura bangladeshensis TaxID=453573 RepID=A0A6L9Q945_9ACTN|nr:hypothetical protein [Actinomadura bangladeshensis]NEA21582.1 hypothetical protein [Actinomadura bangladeshensis]NEA22542.1 hypothetical protein [Actinomadura bangladeshensis]